MATDPQPKKSATEILRMRDEFAQRARQAHERARDLEEQARNEQRNANELTRQAQALDESYASLQGQHTISGDTLKLEDLSKKDAAKIAKARFVFLVDGSRSMDGRFMNATVDGLLKTVDALKLNDTQVQTVLYGNSQPISFNIRDPYHREKVKEGTNCGVDMFSAIVELTDSLKKDQMTYVIVVSDGDLFDDSKEKPAIATMLRDFPKTTLDVVQLFEPPRQLPDSQPMNNFRSASASDARETKIEKMIDGLDIQTSRRRPQVSQATPDTVVEAIIDRLAKRLSEVVPVVKKTPAPKTPAAGK